VPLAATGVPAFGADADASAPAPPDLRALVRRVAGIFAPGAITLTLFVSRTDADGREGAGQADAAGGAVEAAQRAFRAALAAPIPTADEAAPALAYRRTDKINYEFGDYDLAFASFELKP
jgi:S-adenosylmethionine decarboxylase